MDEWTTRSDTLRTASGRAINHTGPIGPLTEIRRRGSGATFRLRLMILIFISD